MPVEEDDALCGFSEVPSSISYPKGGTWHYIPEPWVGPVREPCEKAKKWAERYNQAARAAFAIDSKVLVITEWDHVSNPYRNDR